MINPCEECGHVCEEGVACPSPARDAIKWKARALIAEQQLKLYPEMLAVLKEIDTEIRAPGVLLNGVLKAAAKTTALVTKARRIK